MYLLCLDTDFTRCDLLVLQGNLNITINPSNIVAADPNLVQNLQVQHQVQPDQSVVIQGPVQVMQENDSNTTHSLLDISDQVTAKHSLI